MTTDVDDVKTEVDKRSAAVLVENEGVLVVAKIDAATSKAAIEAALTETGDQLNNAIAYRSGHLEREEAERLRADGGQS